MQFLQWSTENRPLCSLPAQVRLCCVLVTDTPFFAHARATNTPSLTHVYYFPKARFFFRAARLPRWIMRKFCEDDLHLPINSTSTHHYSIRSKSYSDTFGLRWSLNKFCHTDKFFLFYLKFMCYAMFLCLEASM